MSAAELAETWLKVWLVLTAISAFGGFMLFGTLFGERTFTGETGFSAGAAFVGAIGSVLGCLPLIAANQIALAALRERSRP